MAEERKILKLYYKDVILNNGSKEDLRTNSFRFLQKQEANVCFKRLPLKDILLEDFLKKEGGKRKAEFRDLVNFFKCFEKFAVRILVKPWYKDLYTIKIYTGFWKYNFERWISSKTLYRIFNLIGYKKTSGDTLTFETPVDENQVMAIGFELYLVQTQLYLLESTDFLSSLYSIKDIVSGWLNTTGNPVDILEWIGKNKSTIKKGLEFNEKDYSGKNITDETTRRKTFFVNGVPFHCDENGDLIYNSIMYPPREDIEIQSLRTELGEYGNGSGNLTSLSTVNIDDNILYGDGDHSISSRSNSKDRSDGYNLSGSVSMSSPSNYEDRNENFQNFPNEWGNNSSASRQSNHNNENELAKSGICAVARGGIAVSQRDSNEFYRSSPKESYSTAFVHSKTASFEKEVPTHDNPESNEIPLHPVQHRVDYENIKQGKERVNDILKKRIQTGEKKIDEKPHNQEHFVADIYSNILCRPIRIIDGRCDICGKLPAFQCKKCKDIVCQECSKFLSRRTCRDVENGHDYERISLV